ncbi:MAG TPA: cyclic nucleotide-binding domain-containing protein [Egibacteraceae bacterium]|nr:cyclic nucleotide-binding domain-containing protein [Actinomycetota bacterium]HWB72175.1 cyclic nucleotide-binding domain-containing protein [Egibacteraceae bacterium]
MPRPVTHSLVKALHSVPDFAPLEDEDLLQVVGASANLCWSQGSMVFEQGESAEALYVVLSGRVRVFEVTDGNEQEVGEIGPGDYFGEHSLMLDTTHSKGARAVEDSELMVIPKDYFQPLLDANPALADHFRRKVEERRNELQARRR